MDRPHSRAACLVGLLLAGCAGSAPPEDAKAPPSAAPVPGVRLEGAKLTETDGTRTVWELDAERVDYRTSEKLAELVAVRTRFYEDGALASIGEAPRAIFHLDDRRLRLLGGIRVVSPDERRGFEADEVTWLPQAGRLAANGHVRFWRGPNRLQGATLEADRPLRRVTLAGGVTGQAALGAAGTPAPPSPSTMTRMP